jgi:hypothetical protein
MAEVERAQRVVGQPGDGQARLGGDGHVQGVEIEPVEMRVGELHRVDQAQVVLATASRQRDQIAALQQP